MSFIKIARKIAWNFGLDIQRFDADLNFDSAHALMLKRMGIDLTLDVGANIGQFARQLRENYGYSGEIISFEPLSSAREELKVAAAKDARWKVVDYALGDREGRHTLNISANSQSSSLLRMEDTHVNAAPSSQYIATEEILVKRLDDVYAGLGAESRNVFLKLDVQGFEERVLAGAVKTIGKIKAVRLEMSVKPLYESEPLVDAMIARMRELDFHLVAIEPNFADPNTGSLLQVDGLFGRL